MAGYHEEYLKHNEAPDGSHFDWNQQVGYLEDHLSY